MLRVAAAALLRVTTRGLPCEHVPSKRAPAVDADGGNNCTRFTNDYCVLVIVNLDAV